MRRLTTVAMLLCTPLAFADEHEGELSGSIELLYRNVDVDGSERKYDEDFDGLDSGLRLGSFSARWFDEQDGNFDYARVDLFGLGGDPYQRSAAEIGRRDRWDLSLSHWQQDYLYDLFELVGNEDGATWDAQREQSEVRLRILPRDGVKLHLGFQESRRSGDSLFMKDISRNLFQLDAPLDQEQRRFTIGADFKLGPVNVVLRQVQREYDNRFDNSTEDNPGIEDGATSELDLYDWRQRDEGEAPWTTLTVSSPLGERADLTVKIFGTVFGEEELDSAVDVELLGTAFNGNPLGGECAASGDPCNDDADCDAITAGDVCVPLLGTSRATLEGDTLLAQVDLGFDLSPSVALNLQYESFERDLDGRLDRDLDGDGAFEDLDEDGTPGTTTRLEDERSTATLLVSFAPTRRFSGRVGYRLIEHELIRDGFGGPRDADYDSGDDETILVGAVVDAADWLRLTADYEEGDLDQAFASTSLRETDQLRVRARIRPRDGLNVDLSYRDFENRNLSSNFRNAATVIDFDHIFAGESYSAEIRHQAGERVRYTLRWAMQEVDSDTGILFDTAGFGGTAPGRSLFVNDNTQISGRVDFGIGANCSGYLRFATTESDGNNTVVDLTAPSTPALVNDLLIVQEFDDLEVGFDYRLNSSLRVGLSLRDFDYDDMNDLLDYDSRQAIVRVGLEF